ncbi:MAG: MSCRAMM family adhesin SdrC, partial [Gammaproteobacteria bacterium]|nr:MSCRAMM family adhesin SdrC [Gammaproteobacteria bacterium]
MFRKFEIRSSRYAEFLATTVLGRSLSYVLLTVLLVACEEPPNPGITATPVTPVTPIDSNSFEPTNVVVTPADGEVILQWVNPQDPDTTIGSVNIVVQVYANNTNDLSANPPIDQANVLEDYAGDGIPQSYSYPSTNESLYYSFRMAFVASNGETYEPKANADIIERRDSLDIDLDDDGVLNRLDLCARGESGWQSTNITDYDGDGCRDASSEDNDDDNDQVSDDLDSCTRGIMGWQSTSITDYDGDGCQDASPEDEDDDNDRVSDLFDSCARGIIGWESNSTTDYDDDGCRDASPEDEDDDNDRVSDLFDSCARGIIGWESNGTTDYDDDGCQDASPEDTDDDNDGAPDDRDDYPLDRTRQGDGDGIVDAYDIDADGDGLIEIATADELNL